MHTLRDIIASAEAVGSSVVAYGTSEGVKKSWDTRGRSSEHYARSVLHVGRSQAEKELGHKEASVAHRYAADAHLAARDAHVKVDYALDHKDGESKVKVLNDIAEKRSHEAWGASSHANDLSDNAKFSDKLSKGRK